MLKEERDSKSSISIFLSKEITFQQMDGKRKRVPKAQQEKKNKLIYCTQMVHLIETNKKTKTNLNKNISPLYI
jgi:hypothetical protein